MKSSSYYDIQKTFLRGLVARDIAEPLASFDASTPAEPVRNLLADKPWLVVGIRQEGLVIGYIERGCLLGELSPGATCGSLAHPFDPAEVLPDNAGLVELIQVLSQKPVAFVRLLGEVCGTVSRQDLQDPPVRMWLFGLITILELRFVELIVRRYQAQEWQRYLSPARLESAKALQAERHRRSLDTSLLECLQFCDKFQIVVRDEVLRQEAGFVSRKRGDEAIRILERLRNNLAHSQDIINSDWTTIILLAERLDRVIPLEK